MVAQQGDGHGSFIKFNFSQKHQTIIILLTKICIFWASLLLIEVFSTIVRLLAIYIISAKRECLVSGIGLFQKKAG